MVVEKRQVERTHLLGQSRLDIGPDGGRYLTCQPSRGIGALVIVQRSSPASTTSRRRRPPPAACSQVTLSTVVRTRNIPGAVGPSSPRREAFSPVVWTTVLIAVGFNVVVQPELFRGMEPLGRMTVSGFPDAHTDAFRYGLIGAYASILQGLVRSYFHADLRLTYTSLP